MSRLNLFYNYTDLALNNPDHMYLRSREPFITFGFDLFDQATESNRIATFGSSEVPRVRFTELEHILFENPCDVLKSRFERAGLVIEDYFFKNCEQIAEGTLHKGLYALWIETTGMSCLSVSFSFMT